MNKNTQYKKISNEIIENIGGKDNIEGVAHCATRLRIVLKDDSLVSQEEIDNIELVKGVFIAGDQLQIIFGSGLVNDIYKVFVEEADKESLSVDEVKDLTVKKQNPFQQGIKALSDVFIDIMPAILAAALLMGLSGLFTTENLFGVTSLVQKRPALEGLISFVNLLSSSVFGLLPLLVIYSATKRFGGRPIMGLAVGTIMMNNNLADAFQVAEGNVVVDIVNLFGLEIPLIGFQGGVVAALMMGFVVAKLDNYFEAKVPNSVKLLFSPMLTVLISGFLLFTIFGPLGRFLANIITGTLLWVTDNLGVFGYAAFAGVQQLIVITGLHHLFGAIENQLIVDTGANFINPLASVAVTAQGGAVLGYMLLHWNDIKTRELTIPAFTSTLFGISEPAIFGVNLRYKFPLISGCIAAAVGGAYVYLSNLTSLAYGTTGIPGFAIADPSNHGHLNYIIAHIISIFGGAIITYVWGKLVNRKTLRSEGLESE